MLILKLALRNLARNGTRSFAIGTLVALTVTAMTLGNAAFDGTDAGIRRSYIESFTGDLSVSALSREAFSVFGSQTPIIGSLTRMPTIDDFDAVRGTVEATAGVAATSAIVCGIVILESGSYRKPISAFGIEGESYFGLFPGLRVESGLPLGKGEPGIMITAARAAEIAAASGNAPAIGEPLGLSFYSSGGFQFESPPLRGIVAYPVENEVLDSIVLVDAGTMRSLLGLAREAGRKDDGAKGVAAGSIDSLFVGASDVKSDPNGGLRLSDVESLLLEESAPAELSSSSSWNYLLIRLAKGADARRMAASLGAAFSSQGLSVSARDWRATAGASALYISWLRIIFNIGFVVILGAGAIIIVNALVIAVFERRNEIGTMRALGASRPFVRGLFVAETMILVLGSALLGVVIGSAICAIVSHQGVPITNAMARTLFGSDRLMPVATLGSACFDMAAAACVGAIAWIYPVRLALKIEPARAIAAE